MSQLINGPAALAYDPDSTGWTPPDAENHVARRAYAQVRIGYYLEPDTGERVLGDHRVTWEGTTCREVSCYVSHHPGIAPGWPEPVHPDEPYTDATRPGVQAITGVLWGWDRARHLPRRLTRAEAAAAAHLALDALRDAGYKLIPPPDDATTDAPHTPETIGSDDPRQ